MRVLVTTTWGYGHVFPVVPMARALAAAGHEVLWATHEPAIPLVQAAGLEARSVGLDAAGVAELVQRNHEQVGALRPQDRAAHAFPTMFGAGATAAMVAGLLPCARDFGPDLIVHENAELAGPLVAAVLGVPCVTHSFGGAVPPAFVTAAGERLRDLWAQHGLEVGAYAGCFRDGYLDLCPPVVQTVPVDHVGRREPLRPVPYTGELGVPLPAVVGNGRPLVYLTLGTVASSPQVLASAATSLGNLDAELLVTLGPAGDPEALGPLPDNVHVERWVSQSEVLAHCTAVVSHAGSGTFLGALAHGLPQLCLPQAADQFRNAAGAVASGAGLELSPVEAVPQAVAHSVRRLLEEPSFRVAAQAVGRDIARMPSPEQVVPFLEAVAAGRPA